ncbi:MAG TPA: alpha-galactosidase [Mycobacteriales bacterium]|nr:alpha-galactosidase [Mycobacteriales bacterium]
MRSGVVGVVGLALIAGPALAQAATPRVASQARSARDGSAVARVAGDAAVLSDGLITRRWSLTGNEVRTVGLARADGRQLARPAADFTLNLDGVATSSTLGWQLTSVTPARGDGTAELVFDYTLLSASLPSGVRLTRTFALKPGRAAMSVHSTLHSAVVPLRVSAYSLDQICAKRPNQPAEVLAYHEGSDWRLDFRHVKRPKGAFDDEGETLRVGGGAGFFLVSQRRGGLMSRAQRNADGTAAIGVDWARDLFDAGPLLDNPPNYNTIGNPLYPVPVIARLVRPGETLELGTAWTGVYAGPKGQGDNSAAAVLNAAFPWHIDQTIAANSFHPWGHGAGMSGPNLQRQVAAAGRLGDERYMLDDQWQGGPGGESGDWHFDTSRFPEDAHGVPRFVTYLHRHHMQLGLWMSPLEFNMKSRTYARHPLWACLPLGDVTAQVPDDAGLGAWDATNPQFQAYLLGVINRLVKDYDVREFKFDYMAWLDCGTHDYADYEDAFVGLVRRMEAAHPDVTFELDETNDQRAWPFESASLGPSWFDNNHNHDVNSVSELLHDLWEVAPWMPTSTIGIGTYDSGSLDAGLSANYLMPIALLSHPTFWTDFTKLTPVQRRQTRWWLTWFERHRSGIGPMFYELTRTDPLAGKDWLVLQPWRAGSGYVFAFRQNTMQASVRVQLQGVSPATTYDVTDVRTGKLLAHATGAQLRTGLTVTASAAYSARVLRVAPAG